MYRTTSFECNLVWCNVCKKWLKIARLDIDWVENALSCNECQTYLLKDSEHARGELN